MKNRIWLIALALTVLGAGRIGAETIQLKDRNSISAAVIKESADHVYVDLGFDILKIPRTAIASIDAPSASAHPASSAMPAESKGLYTLGNPQVYSTVEGVQEGVKSMFNKIFNK